MDAVKNNIVGERTEALPGDKSPRVRLPRVRFPIRVKITAPFLILAVGLAIGMAYAITQVVFDTIDERFTNQLIESGKLSAESMVRQEESLLRSLRLFSYTEGLPEAAALKDVEQLETLSLGIAANQGEEIVEFLDNQGNLVLGLTHQPGGDAGDYSTITESDVDYSQLPFVANVLEGRVDEFGDKYSGLAQNSQDDVFFTAGPLVDTNDQLSGVVLVGRTVDSMLRQIHDETLAQVTVYESDGTPAVSTFYEPLLVAGDEAALVLANQNQSSLRRNIGSRRGLNISNIDYDEILGPWEGRGNEDLGIIGVSLPRTFLVRASNATRLQITGLASFSLLLVIMLGVYIASAITRPLRNLVEASAEVAEGNLQVQIKPHGNDEVTVLTRSFNTMISTLNQSKVDLLNAYDRTLEGWSMALELRDQETEGHTRRVAELTLELSELMSFEGEALVHIRRGALLHDIGKMGIPDSILLKPGALSAEEWVVMRRHPEFAYQLLWPIEYLRPAIPIPFSHHEWWNGGGYPQGLSSEGIPLPARIFAVIDVWDAMRSDRPYRAAIPEGEVREYLQKSRGVHFDGQVVEAFFDLLERKNHNGDHSTG
ncbi:MAG: HAMP domain-containing protein [Anaerolineales bacterium]|nr:HAMP domain-containing protein [Anaerolineales bacterium]